MKAFDANGEVTKDTAEGSIFWAEVNPEDNDPKKISYAVGYRVYLLVKDRETQKWTFPRIKMRGTRPFKFYKDRITIDFFEPGTIFSYIGPAPALKLTEMFEKPKVRTRPQLFSDD
jgi:hypothetical protein